jgi:hypothetical protein
MKFRDKIGFIVIFLVFTILFSQLVLSLGVAPARKIINFEPEYEGEVEIKIYNSAYKDMKTFLYVEGDLKDNIELDKTELIFSPSEEYKIVKYKIKLPSKLSPPGDHINNVVVREVPVDSDSNGAVIGSSVAVVHQVVVKVPYPGTYAVAELRIVESNSLDKVDFVASVNNLGSEKIDAAKGLIDIYDSHNQKIVSLETNLDSVGSKKTKGLMATWDENVELGKYTANLVLTYDGKVAEDQREFYVGKLFVDIIDILVEGFKLGEIAKFVILVENQWPDQINEVYTEFIFSKLGEEVAVVKSASESIDALFSGELVAYWDTEGIEEGMYDTVINLHYNDQKIEKDMKTYVGLDSITFDLFGAGAVIADTEGLDKLNLAIIAVIVLLLANLGWFIYFKKFRKK